MVLQCAHAILVWWLFMVMLIGSCLLQAGLESRTVDSMSWIQAAYANGGEKRLGQACRHCFRASLVSVTV